MTSEIRLPCYKGSLAIYLYDGMISGVRTNVPPETVAHGLAAVSRFGGQTRKPYSVAEHSVRLGWLLRDWGYGPAFEKAALLHDAPECFGVGDLNSFVKKALGLYRLKHLDTAIVSKLWSLFGCEEKYGLTWTQVDDAVTVFDKWLGHWEAKQFGFYVPPEIGFDPDKFRKPGTHMATLVGYWDHEKAKEAWLWNWGHCDGRPASV